MSENPLTMLVAADDLTGANDTSVSFADAGYRTVLLMDESSAGAALDTEVTAMSTDSRPSGDSARARTRALVEAALAGNIDRLYLKVDSTMRGSVQHQVRGALDAWTTAHPDAVAVVCSAYPAMGRTVIDGVLKVNGVDVDQTASGRDPVCPVTTPHMGELIPGAAVLPNPGDAAGLAEAIRTAGSDVVVVDAVTQEDLAVIAEAIDTLGRAAIPVGSAGLSKELTRFLPAPVTTAPEDPLPVTRRPLVVVSSIHETSQEQVDRFIGSADGGPAIVFSPHPAQLRAPEALPALRAQLLSLLGSGDGPVIIRANPARLADEAHRDEVARSFAAQLAELAAACLHRHRFGALVLVGGDGAAATLAEIGAKRLTIVRPVAEGVPVGTVLGGEFHGLPVVTKSGGFGGPDLLCQIMSTLYGKKVEA